MKLEAGKYYRTRDGRKAYVAAIAPEWVATDYPVLGWVDIATIRWRADGKEVRNESPCDLISEWTDEPEKKEDTARYLYAYHNIIEADESGEIVSKGVSFMDGKSKGLDRSIYIGRIRLEPME
jgi:hypothetical protein